MSKKKDGKKKRIRAKDKERNGEGERSWIDRFVRENPKLADSVPSHLLEKAKKNQL